MLSTGPTIDRSEGDVNLSPARGEWQAAHIDADTQQLLDADARVFLHQSLSTPVLNALESCDGIYITDTQGRRYMARRDYGRFCFHRYELVWPGFSFQRIAFAI